MSIALAEAPPVASQLFERLTAEDLLHHPNAAGFELVDGVLKERAMSGQSSAIGLRLGRLLDEFAELHQLGYVFGCDNSYQCFEETTFDPDRVRKPDVSFVAIDRLTQTQFEKGHFRICPDLAVEVVSPNEDSNELETKIEEYLAAGVKLVWIVYPVTKTVYVIRPDGTDSRLHVTDELSGESVIPGFRCPLAKVFVTVRK